MVFVVNRLLTSILHGLLIYHLSSQNRPNVAFMKFSPLKTFLVTWEYRQLQNASENLLVWDLSTGSNVMKFTHKELSAKSWPLQWSSDEEIVCLGVTNEVKVFNGRTCESKVLTKLVCPNMCTYSIAPAGKPYSIAVFSPQKGSDPARMSIYRFPLFEENQAVATKTFFQAEEAELHWSPTGQAILVHTHTETDRTGKSYYGATNVFLLQVDGSFAGAVPSVKEGPIQDVAWSPSGKDFIVVQGFQPAKAILYAAKDCTPVCHLHQCTVFHCISLRSH